jgi:hypothetical protein
MAVHDYVTGHVAVRLARGEAIPLPGKLGPRQERTRRLFERPDYDRRFQVGLEMLVIGADSFRRS